MKVANLIMLTINVVAAVFLAWLLTTGAHTPDPIGWSYNDFISVILTALGAILSAVTLVLAIVAIWGFQNLSRSAESVAEKTAREHQKAYIESPDFQLMLRQLISEQKENDERERARKGVELGAPDGGPGNDAGDAGDEAWAD